MILYDANGNTINVQENRLYGKIITAVGDSYVSNDDITERDKVWLARIATRNNMTAHNMGVSGESIKEMVTAQRYKNIPANSDYIVIFQGHNDVNYKYNPLGTIDDTTTDTFYGCLDVLCKGLMNLYPKAKKLFITPTHRVINGNNINTPDYVKAMKDVCYRYSIPCWDAYGGLDILINNMEGVNQREEFELNKNGSYTIHLNALGNEYISYKIEEQLKLL